MATKSLITPLMNLIRLTTPQTHQSNPTTTPSRLLYISILINLGPPNSPLRLLRAATSTASFNCFTASVDVGVRDCDNSPAESAAMRTRGVRLFSRRSSNSARLRWRCGTVELLKCERWERIVSVEKAIDWRSSFEACRYSSFRGIGGRGEGLVGEPGRRLDSRASRRNCEGGSRMVLARRLTSRAFTAEVRSRVRTRESSAWETRPVGRERDGERVIMPLGPLLRSRDRELVGGIAWRPVTGIAV